MTIYRLLLLLKFIGVALYAGGLVAGVVPSSLADRRRAVHRIASPGLVVVWIAGYLLVRSLLLPLTEAWILGGLVLSVVSQLALIRSVAGEVRSPVATGVAAGALLLILVLMVFRP